MCICIVSWAAESIIMPLSIGMGAGAGAGAMVAVSAGMSSVSSLFAQPAKSMSVSNPAVAIFRMFTSVKVVQE